jgi:hypothetical protein
MNTDMGLENVEHLDRLEGNGCLRTRWWFKYQRFDIGRFNMVCLLSAVDTVISYKKIALQYWFIENIFLSIVYRLDSILY